MGSSPGVRHERQETRSEQHLHLSLGSRGQLLLEVSFFAEFFSALTQFWHRCQNDLFTEKLDGQSKMNLHYRQIVENTLL